MASITTQVIQKRELIEKDHSRLSILQQCILLGVCRSGLYYSPKTTLKPDELSIKECIDKQFTKMPYYGIRRMTMHLKNEGFLVNEKRVRRYYSDLCICAIYPKPKGTLRNREHEIFPYLLRNLPIERKNQVWSTDITYIPMENGYMYLCAIIDWHSRYILSWGISNTHDSEFCQELLNEAITKYGVPEIFNTDQGSEFTAKGFVDILKKHGIQISMDGKGRALDNIFIERFWRSVKYEYLYLVRPTTGVELYAGLADYFQKYNEERLHHALDFKTPRQIYMAA